MKEALVIYLIGIPVIFMVVCFACIIHDMDNNIHDMDNNEELYSLKQAVGISLFWPIWIVFNLPKWIWITVKFFFEVTVGFVKDLFKI